MKTRVVSGMKRARAKRFPRKVRIKLLDWDVSADDRGRITFDLRVPGLDAPVQFATTPDDAYELMSEIGYAYDKAVGI
jgi:hypothetical protein